MLTAYATSNLGLVRKSNEDGFICLEAFGLFAVADGMGGHLAGEVASRLALEAVEEYIRHAPGEAASSAFPDSGSSPAAERLGLAIQLANERVYRSSQALAEHSGMGTTLTAVLVGNGRLAFGHVGDSRLYVLSGRDFRQLTRDDSWVATVLANDPSLTAAELARHPMRHVLTSVLGVREEVPVQVGEVALEGEQLFLLCTDGLHGLVDDATLETILRSGETLEDIASRLVRTALDRGGHDNVTAVLIRNGTEV